MLYTGHSYSLSSFSFVCPKCFCSSSKFFLEFVHFHYSNSMNYFIHYKFDEFQLLWHYFCFCKVACLLKFVLLYVYTSVYLALCVYICLSCFMCIHLSCFMCIHLFVLPCDGKKGTSRQRSGKGAIRKRFPLQKPRWEKTKLTIRYLYHETYRKPNEQLFSQ